MCGSISFIVPTIGRDSLRTTLESIASQMHGNDEVIVVSDGPQLSVPPVVKSFGPRFKCFEYGPTGRYGNAQRDFGIKNAVQSHLAFMDDDDCYLPGAIEIVHGAIGSAPVHPLLFRMAHRGTVIWRDQILEFGNVSTQMFVVPNISGCLGQWDQNEGDGQGCDFSFIRDTVAKWPPDSLIWQEEIISELKEHSGGK